MRRARWRREYYKLHPEKKPWRGVRRILAMIVTSQILERFLAKVEFPDDVENECWSWIGNCHQAGYGVFVISGAPYLSHRLSYDHFWGPIPEGMELHHNCGTKLCVNPRHLEPISKSDHAKGELNKRYCRTHCANGHLLSAENIYWYHRKIANRTLLSRKCKICLRERHKRNSQSYDCVHRAIRSGELMRPHQCEICGNSKPDAHHSDYSKPLEVVWLCRSCHQRLHALHNNSLQ
jgi:hypothetical protein